MIYTLYLPDCSKIIEFEGENIKINTQEQHYFWSRKLTKKEKNVLLKSKGSTYPFKK